MLVILFPRTYSSTCVPKTVPRLLSEVYALDTTLLELSVTNVKPPQSAKALLPKLITFSGMVIDVKLLQPEKAWLPMSVTLSGMVTEAKLLQPLKAEMPMYVTLLGIVTDVRLVQFSKAAGLIPSTLYPSTSFCISITLQFLSSGPDTEALCSFLKTIYLTPFLVT